MRYQYVVILKKSSERATNLLSILLCFLSAVVFGYESFQNKYYNYFRIVAAAILLGLVLYAIVQRKRRRRMSYRYLLFVAAIFWFGMPYLSWIGFLFVLLAFLEHQTKRPLEIGFDSDRIVINSMIRQSYDWAVFNNVVLKDGLLTLDFKNNRLMQKEIADDDDDDDADEEEFNAWCRDRLAAADKRNILPLHP